MQRFAYNIIKSQSEQPSPKDPLLLIIIGVAGTGKSYLIHAIRNLLQACCAITATTGKASYNIGGSTIHSLLKLPTKTIKEILSTKRRQGNERDQSPKGCYKCGKKCDFCNNYMHESSTFVSSQTGVKYPIKQNICCNSQNVVYLVTCIGSTSTELKVRFRNHKSMMINNKRTCEVAMHFQTCQPPTATNLEI